VRGRLLVVGVLVLGCEATLDVRTLDLTGDPLDCAGGCACAAAQSCRCDEQATCTQVCLEERCEASCDGADCAFLTEQEGSFVCLGPSVCEGSLATGAVACLDDSHCEFLASGAMRASCAGTADCRFTAGDGSVVTCAGTGPCEVICQGSCLVQCTGACSCLGEGCSLSCAGTPPRACPAGGLSCQSTC